MMLGVARDPTGAVGYVCLATILSYFIGGVVGCILNRWSLLLPALLLQITAMLMWFIISLYVERRGSSAHLKSNFYN